MCQMYDSNAVLFTKSFVAMNAFTSSLTRPKMIQFPSMSLPISSRLDTNVRHADVQACKC